MTCVTAACASHLVLGLKFPEPAQAGLGVTGTEFSFFSACSGLLVRAASTVGLFGLKQTGCVGRKYRRRKVWDFGKRVRTILSFNWIQTQ